MRKIEKAISKKSNTVVKKAPYLMEALPMDRVKLLKSTLPVRIEMAGITMSFTREVTIFWNAPPYNDTDC